MLSLEEIIRLLVERGFRPISPHRYATYYRRWPGRPMRLLSSRLLLPIARTAMKSINLSIGRNGNKLTVQAMRRSS